MRRVAVEEDAAIGNGRGSGVPFSKLLTNGGGGTLVGVMTGEVATITTNVFMEGTISTSNSSGTGLDKRGASSGTAAAVKVAVGVISWWGWIVGARFIHFMVEQKAGMFDGGRIR